MRSGIRLESLDASSPLCALRWRGSTAFTWDRSQDLQFSDSGMLTTFRRVSCAPYGAVPLAAVRRRHRNDIESVVRRRTRYSKK